MNVANGLGESWLIEHLTTEIDHRVIQLLQETEDRGGAVRGIETGWFQKVLADQAYPQQKEVESGERTVVGVNRSVTTSLRRCQSSKWTPP